MAPALVDSEILIDILNGLPGALVWLSAMPALGITPINWLEVMTGARSDPKARRLSTQRFLSSFDMHYFSDADQVWAMDAFRRYNPEFGIKWTDLMIAAVCVRTGATLFARDAHFSRIAGLKMVVPYPAGT